MCDRAGCWPWHWISSRVWRARKHKVTGRPPQIITPPWNSRCTFNIAVVFQYLLAPLKKRKVFMILYGFVLSVQIRICKTGLTSGIIKPSAGGDTVFLLHFQRPSGLWPWPAMTAMTVPLPTSCQRTLWWRPVQHGRAPQLSTTTPLADRTTQPIRKECETQSQNAWSRRYIFLKQLKRAVQWMISMVL